MRAAPSITARWQDEDDDKDEDEEQKKQKEREREREQDRELCMYIHVFIVCTFPIFHFLYPYSNTIGKMGE